MIQAGTPLRNENNNIPICTKGINWESRIYTHVPLVLWYSPKTHLKEQPLGWLSHFALQSMLPWFHPLLADHFDSFLILSHSLVYKALFLNQNDFLDLETFGNHDSLVLLLATSGWRPEILIKIRPVLITKDYLAPKVKCLHWEILIKILAFGILFPLSVSILSFVGFMVLP